jgi:hypothetical protein
VNAAAGNENTFTTYTDGASGNGSVQANKQGIQIPMMNFYKRAKSHFRGLPNLNLCFNHLKK